MDAQILPKLPVINFGEENLKPGTPSWSSTCSDVRRAFEEYGCFLAVYDIIPSELRDKVFHASEELFNLPTETKVKNASEISLFGYYGQNPYLQIYESLGISDATTLETIRSFSELMWLNGDHNFCEIVHRYAKLLSQLDQLLVKMVFESYGVEKHCDNHIDSTTYLLRLNKYRVPRDDETDMGAPVHTDKTFITILDQNQVNGLQVQTKDEQWISVDFLPSSFAVMAGDGMRAWSNGRVHSAFHRVLMSGKETRYSLGTFSYHKGMVQIPEELIDEEHPRCFKPFDHLGLLSFYSQEIQAGRIQGSLIKAYCGV